MIDFWLVFSALVFALFSVGRLFWPDPDNSVSERSEEQLRKLRKELAGPGIIGILQRLLFLVIFLFYFPYNKPMAGLAISGLLIAAVYFI